MIGTKLESLFETQLFKIHTHAVHMTQSRCWVCIFCSNCVKLFWSGQGIIRQVANSFPDSELLEVIRKVGVTFMPPATVGQDRASGCYAIFDYSRIQSNKFGQNWTRMDNSGSQRVSLQSTTSGRLGSKVAMSCGPVDSLDIIRKYSSRDHTWYLSRLLRACPCKFFLAGVNFDRFNAKNWQFTVYFAVI